MSRRKRESCKRGSLREQRTVLQVLVRSLSPIKGGSNPKALETTRKLLILKQVEIPKVIKGNINPANKGSRMLWGLLHMRSDGVGEVEKGNRNKNEGKEFWDRYARNLQKEIKFAVEK